MGEVAMTVSDTRSRAREERLILVKQIPITRKTATYVNHNDCAPYCFAIVHLPTTT